MSDDPNARHLANLEEMKAALAAMVARWAYEDVAIAKERVVEQEAFEAGLAHFAEVTGLHDAVAPVLRDVRGEKEVEPVPTFVPPEPVYTGLLDQSPGEERAQAIIAGNNDEATQAATADSGAVKTGGGAIHF